MFTLALVFFILAALGGITMAAMHFTGKSIPMILAVVHGAAAVIGLALFLVAVIGVGAGGSAVAALIFFLLAAAGGLVMFLGYYLRGRPLPSGLVVVHGLAALTGLILLIVYISAAHAAVDLELPEEVDS
ncbi:MAG: hypothetical protein C4524_13580 [Candidatus Zixiibacteriota bacterium]|nr:MAG: hypothetical protein C4524_13580 [candidate division Zixibacteria bacterium]